QGYYDRDNRMYQDWDVLSRSAEDVQAWLEEWVIDVDDRKAYLAKLGPERIEALRPGSAPAEPVNYGVYR
ncbi:MAG: CoA transferase subunit A, partial [Anaerolineales bacterium]